MNRLDPAVAHGSVYGLLGPGVLGVLLASALITAVFAPIAVMMHHRER